MPGPTAEVLNDDIKELRSDMRAEFAAMRAEHKAEFAAVRAESAAMRAEHKAEFAAVRAEFAAMRADLKAEFAAVRAEARDLAIAQAETRVFIRLATWVGAILVTTLLTGGVSAIWWAGRTTERAEQTAAEVRRLADVVAKIAPAPIPTPAPPNAPR